MKEITNRILTSNNSINEFPRLKKNEKNNNIKIMIDKDRFTLNNNKKNLSEYESKIFINRINSNNNTIKTIDNDIKDINEKIRKIYIKETKNIINKKQYNTINKSIKNPTIIININKNEESPNYIKKKLYPNRSINNHRTIDNSENTFNNLLDDINYRKKINLTKNNNILLNDLNKIQHSLIKKMNTNNTPNNYNSSYNSPLFKKDIQDINYRRIKERIRIKRNKNNIYSTKNAIKKYKSQYINQYEKLTNIKNKNDNHSITKLLDGKTFFHGNIDAKTEILKDLKNNFKILNLNEKNYNQEKITHYNFNNSKTVILDKIYIPKNFSYYHSNTHNYIQKMKKIN